jgi:DNA-binding MarR family transcriptional regulator
VSPPAPAPIPDSLAQETGYLLRRAYAHAGDWATASMPEGIPIRDYEVLQTLADLGPSSQRRLSELLWVNRTIMVKLIDALESGGLVERRRDPADRRSYALEPTSHGHDILRQARGAITHINDQLDNTLGGRPRRDELNRLLRKLLQAAGDQRPS